MLGKRSCDMRASIALCLPATASPWSQVKPMENATGSVKLRRSLGSAPRRAQSRLTAVMQPERAAYRASCRHVLAVQVLQDRYGGWLSERVVGDYLKFANAVFSALGDRVTLWATFNEPWTFCFNGYGTGGHAPGLPVRWQNVACGLRPSACGMKIPSMLSPRTIAVLCVFHMLYCQDFWVSDLARA